MFDRIPSAWKFFRHRRSRRVLFSGDTPMNFVTFQSVYERLRRDPRIAVFFSAHSMPFNEILFLYTSLGIPSDCIVDAATACRAKWDLFYTPIRFGSSNNARIKVKSMHGVSFKGKHYMNPFKGFDYIICPGPFLRKVYEENGTLTAGDPRLVLTGFPKIDALVDGSLDRASLLSHYGFSAHLPVVLYAPTWNPSDSEPGFREKVVRALSAQPVQLLVKLHDHDVQQREQVASWLAAKDRVAEGYDSTPCLFLADLLVSDASSVANEYTVLDRPIVFTEPPGLLEQYPHHRYDTGWGRQIGEIAKTPEDLGAIVQKSLQNPKAKSEIRRQAARDLFFDPGHATDHTVRKIYEWLELEMLAL